MERSPLHSPPQSTLELDAAAPAGCLEAAALLGRRIANQAIWHGDRCAWVGASIEEGRGGTALTYATLGSDLYGGTSGVALFLAELAAATGESIFMRTASGAINHALAREPELERTLDASLYTGRIGIAVAATAVGTASGKAAYVEAARRIIATLHRPSARTQFDVISGRAGAILGLMWLSTKAGEPRYREEALRLAEELADSAQRSAASGDASWESDLRAAAGNLTGFSHGCSGAACALLEVATAMKQPLLSLVADRAFLYERSRFDARERNWPDLRRGSGAAAGSPQRSYPVAWCHGAAGIGLARLRAFELTGDSVLRQEAEAALETTAVHTEALLRAGTGSYSLCHGLAGNAEILNDGARIIGRRHWRALALHVAEAGIERYASPGTAWPCGVPEGETPSLMLGLAGAGMFFLRLVKPTVDSALLLTSRRDSCTQVR